MQYSGSGVVFNKRGCDVKVDELIVEEWNEYFMDVKWIRICKFELYGVDLIGRTIDRVVFDFGDVNLVSNVFSKMSVDSVSVKKVGEKMYFWKTINMERLNIYGLGIGGNKIDLLLKPGGSVNYEFVFN